MQGRIGFHAVCTDADLDYEILGVATSFGVGGS